MNKVNRFVGCLIVVLIVILGIYTPKVKAETSSINNIEIDIKLDNDGTANVTEIWKTNIYDTDEMYKPYYGLGEFEITDLSVIDENKIKYEYVSNWNINATQEEKANKCGIYVNTEQGGVEICWGISSFGEHTYTLKYKVSNFVRQKMGYQSINFKLLQANMDPKPEKVSITLSGNFNIDDSNTLIEGLGFTGESKIENGKILFVADNGLKQEDYVAINVEFENSPFIINDNNTEAYSENGILSEPVKENNVLKWVIYIIVGVILGIGVIVFLEKNNIDKKKKK